MNEVYSTKSHFDVIVLQFKPDNPANLSSRFKTDEIQEIGSGIKIPTEFINSLSYSDHIENSSFSISISDGGMKWIETLTGKIRLREILDEGTIIVITENGNKKFAGRVNSITDLGSIEGEENYKVSGGGLETAISEQTIFIDYSDETKSTLEKTPGVATNLSGKIKAVLKEIVKVITNAKNPTLMLKSLCDAAINQLLSNGKYGGYLFKHILDYANGTLSNDTYSNNFLHTLQWLNQVGFGNTISFWNLMTSIAKPPLYELFVHYDSASDLHIDSEKTLGKNGELTGIDTSISAPFGYLVFRKTPLDKIRNESTDTGFAVKVPCNILSSFDFSSSTNNIFSGVHINLGILDNMTSLVLNPVTYNPVLLGKFGQRVFNVTLDGIGFPKDATTEADKKSFKDKIASIQDLLYSVFGQGDRIVSGSIHGTYMRGICKGQYMEIVSPNEMDSLPKRLRRYDPHFYITGVDVTWSPGSGMADMTLSVKWGRKSNRKEDSSF